MGNKYYDGLIFRIPQICMPGSFMGECAERAGVGFVCDPYDTDFTERVYAYYRGLAHSEFDGKCDVELEKVMEEYADANDIKGGYVMGGTMLISDDTVRDIFDMAASDPVIVK